MNFPKDLATKLNTEISSLTLGTNLLYNTKMPDNDNLPDKLVVIYSGLPKRAERCLSGAREVVYKRATILVRSNINGSYEDIEDLCEEIYATLQSVVISPYEDIYFKNSGFSQEMKDEQNRYIWVGEIEGWYNRSI